MHKIGIISDTHGLLRPEVASALGDCEAILHGGDINKQKILDELKEIAPVYAVRGNNDKEWADYIPETLEIDLFGLKIFMVHNKKYIPQDTGRYDLVVYGHSHKYDQKEIGATMFLNPGSCGPRRFTQPITMAVATIRENLQIDVKKIDISHHHSVSNPVNQNSAESGDYIPYNIADIIPLIMKDIQAGKTVKRISKRHKISETLARQICRLYLTHPGVDVDGILRRMGL